MTIDHDRAWAAVSARDGRADGTFVFAVRTTGIYCRPSCPARRPKRENTAFFRTPDDAETAGYRECRRCRPRGEGGPAAEKKLVDAAARLIAARAGEPLRIADVARELGAAPSRLSRLFARYTGLTPKRFALARRFDAYKTKARRVGVVAAQYDAGFGAPSRLYAAAGRHLGMTPGAYARGGRGETIRYGFAASSVGLVLAAFTDRGVCAAELGDDRAEMTRRLRARFPDAVLVPGARVSVETLPAAALDLRGTAFQLAVWRALRAIPPGRTKTYAEVAQDLGRPRAVRAVARACATNPAALAVPCHRVVGSDGSLRGYKWGVERKRRLLETEARR